MSSNALYKTNEREVTSQKELDEDIQRLLNHVATCSVLSTFMAGLMSLHWVIDHEGKHAGETACTDGFTVWINPEYWNINNTPQKIGLMYHEMFHCLWIHFWRFMHAVHFIANIATDIRINAFIKELSAVSSRIQLPANPPGAQIVYSDKYGDDSEEVIYHKLLEEQPKGPGDNPGDGPGGNPGDKKGKKGKGNGSGKGKGKPEDGKGKGKPEEATDWSKFKSPGGFTAPPEKTKESEEGDTASDTAKKLRDKWEQAQQSIAQAARLNGSFPGNLIEELERTKPGVDWKARLRDFVLSTSATDVSEELFDTRFLSGIDETYEELFIEAIDSPVVENIVFAKDTSGSMDSMWLSQACSEIQEAMRTVKIKRLWVIDIDTDMDGIIEEYGPNDQIDFSAKGRGGTDFRPPFKWAIEECPVLPKALIYFTDGYGPFPDEEPPFPTLWATFGLAPEEYPQWKNSKVIDMREIV